MPSEILKKYILDQSIPLDKRKNLANDLDSGAIDESTAEKIITEKYKGKYAPGSLLEADMAKRSLLGSAGTFGDIGREIGAGGVQAGAAVGKGMANILGGLGNILENPGEKMAREAAAAQASKQLGRNVQLRSGGEQLQNIGQQFARSVESAGDTILGPTSGIGKGIGEFTGQLAAQIPGLILGGQAAAGIPKFGAGQFFANIPRALVSGGIGTESATLGTMGRPATAEELGTGAAIDVGLLGLGTMAKKLAPGLFGSALGAKAPTSEGIEKINQRAIDLNLAGGSRKQIKQKAAQVISSSGEEMQKLLKGHKAKFKTVDLFDDLTKQVNVYKKAYDFKNADLLQKEIDSFRKGLPKTIDATDLLNLKQHASQNILPQLRKASLGSVSASAEKQLWENVWKKSGNMLNKISPQVKNLNLNMTTGYAVKEAAEAQLKKGPFIFNLVSPFKSAAQQFAPSIAGLAGKLGKVGGPTASLPLGKQTLKSTIFDMLGQGVKNVVLPKR